MIELSRISEKAARRRHRACGPPTLPRARRREGRRVIRLNRKARGRGRRSYIALIHVLLIGIAVRLARAMLNARVIPSPYPRCARRVRIVALAAAHLIAA